MNITVSLFVLASISDSTPPSETLTSRPNVYFFVKLHNSSTNQS